MSGEGSSAGEKSIILSLSAGRPVLWWGLIGLKIRQLSNCYHTMGFSTSAPKSIFARKKNHKNRLLASFCFIFFDTKHLLTLPGSGNFHGHLHILPLDRGVCSCNKSVWITLVVRHCCPQDVSQLAAELCTCAVAFLPLPHCSYCHYHGVHYPVCNSKTEF